MSWKPPSGPQARAISDNDYSGDPDGLVQLVHHALSGSVERIGVIGSRLRTGDPFDPSATTADDAAALAAEHLGLIDRPDVGVHAGCHTGLVDRSTPIDSGGAEHPGVEAPPGATADTALMLRDFLTKITDR